MQPTQNTNATAGICHTAAETANFLSQWKESFSYRFGTFRA